MLLWLFLKNPVQKNLVLDDEKGHRLRLLQPLIAEQDCLACHAGSKQGDVLGVMDMTFSFDEIDAYIDVIAGSGLYLYTFFSHCDYFDYVNSKKSSRKSIGYFIRACERSLWWKWRFNRKG